MNRKLLIIQFFTVILVFLSAIFVNFLTNDQNINNWLSANGIGTKTIVLIVVLITVSLLVLEYFKLRNQSQNEFGEETQQTINSEDDSSKPQISPELNIDRFNEITSQNQTGGQTALNITNIYQNIAPEKNNDKLDVALSLYLGGQDFSVDTPTDFVGRKDIINELISSKGVTHIITILGIAGVGKTALLRQLSTKLGSNTVFWQEFKEGLLSLDDLLVGLAHFFNNQPNQRLNLLYEFRQNQLTEREKIELVINELNETEYYLFFDSIHLIDGHPELNSFFSLLKDRLRNGVIFVNGRTKPNFYTPIDVSRNVVKVVDLEGLDIDETKVFFENKGISLSLEQLESIDDSFNGLPLALELLAALLTQGLSDSELLELISKVEGQTVEYLFQEVYQRLEQAERNLLTVASLFSFPFSQTDLKNSYKALFNEDDASTQITKLKQKFLIKQVTLENGQIHEVIKTMCLKYADVDLASIRIKFADSLLQNMSDEFGSRLEATISYLKAGAFDQAAELVTYLTEWLLPYFPQIAETLSNRIEIEKVSPQQRFWLLESFQHLASELRRTKQEKEYALAMLDLAEELEDKSAIALALQRLGIVYSKSDSSRSEKYYLNSLALKKELDDKDGQAQIYNNLGLLYIADNRFKEAWLMFENALKLRESIGSSPDAFLSVYSNLGILYGEQKLWKEAEKYSKLAYETALKMESEYEIARTLYSLAVHKDRQNKNEEAIQEFLEVLNMSEEFGFWQIQELAHGALGLNYYKLGKFEEAIEHFEILAEIQESIEDKPSLAITYLDIGTFYLGINDQENALTYYEKVASLFVYLTSEKQIELFLNNMFVFAATRDKQIILDLLKDLKNRLLLNPPSYSLAQVYITLGEIYKDLYSKQRVGFACLKRAETILAAINAISAQASLLIDIGVQYEELNQVGKAINTLNKAVSIAKNYPDKLLIIAYYNRANLYTKVEMWQEAEEDYRFALKLAEENKNVGLQQKIIHNFGELLRRQDKLDEAIPFLHTAINIAKEEDDVDGEITAWNNLGLAYEFSDEKEALRAFQKALSLSHKHFRKRDEANVLISLGNFYFEKDHLDKAKDFYEQSFEAAKQSEDAEMEENSMLSLAYVHRKLGTINEIEKEFQVIAERAGKLEHYENLLLFLTFSGEINFDEKEIEESAKMFEQAFYVAIIQDAPLISEFDSLTEGFHFPSLSKVLVSLLKLFDKALNNNQHEELQNFQAKLVDIIEKNKEWKAIGSTITDLYLNPFGQYLKELPDQNIVGYVTEKMITKKQN